MSLASGNRGRWKYGTEISGFAAFWDDNIAGEARS